MNAVSVPTSVSSPTVFADSQGLLVRGEFGVSGVLVQHPLLEQSARSRRSPPPDSRPLDDFDSGRPRALHVTR